MRVKIGDEVLCYSCKRCRIERRPRNKEHFSGTVTAMRNGVATVRSQNGFDMYYHVCCLEKLNNN